MATRYEYEYVLIAARTVNEMNSLVRNTLKENAGWYAMMPPISHNGELVLVLGHIKHVSGKQMAKSRSCEFCGRTKRPGRCSHCGAEPVKYAGSYRRNHPKPQDRIA